MAPTITKASEGSQRPARSRKPSTLAGLAMPETIRPMPNSRPASSAVMALISGSDQVMGDENGQKACRHEGQRGHQRTDGPTRDTADAVAAGASARVARADPDQKARDEHLAPACLDIGLGRHPEQRGKYRCADQPYQEGHPPRHVAARQAQQPAQ